MTGERDQELRPPKRLILRAALRSVLIAAVLMALYYVLPLDRPWDSDTAIRLLIGLVIVAGVMVWGVRIIVGSRYPGLRDITSALRHVTSKNRRHKALKVTPSLRRETL
jgi:hypothetical protein